MFLARATPDVLDLLSQVADELVSLLGICYG